MANARQVIKQGFLQGDLDFNGFKALNIDLTDIISTQFGLQTANRMFAGPGSGVPANPTFRAMVAADLPASAMLTTQNLAGLADKSVARDNLNLTAPATAASSVTGLQLLDIDAPALEGVNFLCSNDGQPEWVTPATALSNLGAEAALGNPGTTGFILSSTTGGVRSWVAQTAAVLPALDSTEIIKGSVDQTKRMRLDVSGVSSGQTRVLTVPNFNGTLATLAGVESLSNKVLNLITFDASGSPREVTFKGDAAFETPGGLILRTAGASDVTLPATGTLATLAGAETLTNKTISGGIFLGDIALRSSAGAFNLTLQTDDDTNQSLTFRTNDGDRILYLGGNLAIDGALIFSGAFSTNFTVTGNSTLELPLSGTLATRENAEILANKTLEAVAALGIVSSDSGFDLNIFNRDVDASADRTLSIDLNNVNRAIDLTGNLTLAHDFATVGAFALTLTQTATTNVTLPTTGIVEARVGVPASAAAVGIAGQKAYDASFEYRCIASGQWVRSAHATW